MVEENQEHETMSTLDTIVSEIVREEIQTFKAEITKTLKSEFELARAELSAVDSQNLDVFPFNNKQPFYNKHDLFDGGFTSSVRNAATMLKEVLPSRKHGSGDGYLVVDYLSLVEYMYPNHIDKLLPQNMDADPNEIDLVAAMKAEQRTSN